MNNDLIALLIAACTVTAVGMVFSIQRLLGRSKRPYLDPLPVLLMPLWPGIRLLEYLLEPLLRQLPEQRLQHRMRLAGWQHRLTTTEFRTLQGLLAVLLASLAAWLLSHFLQAQNLTLVLICGLAGALFPWLRLCEAAKSRCHRIKRELPVYLDFLTLSLDAGLSLTGGLQQAVRQAPPGPFQEECSEVLRDIRRGASHAEALRRLAERLALREVQLMVSALLQAEQSGGNLSDTLRIQATQRREERFQAAEKAAMQAPIKLIFPLVVCIFPVTFLILAFPIAMKVLHGF